MFSNRNIFKCVLKAQNYVKIGTNFTAQGCRCEASFPTLFPLPWDCSRGQPC